MRKKRKNEVRERESKQRDAKKEEKRGRRGKEMKKKKKQAISVPLRIIKPALISYRLQTRTPFFMST
jgi:hypothetical protein